MIHMTNIIERVVKKLHLNFPRMFYVKLLTEDANFKDKLAADPTQNITNIATAKATNIVGDDAATGQILATYSLAAYKKLAIYVINLNANKHTLFRIGTGTLAAMTDYLELRVAAAGDIMRESATPLTVIDNSAGASAINVRLYLPRSIDGAATNNDTSHYAAGFFSGVVY